MKETPFISNVGAGTPSVYTETPCSTFAEQFNYLMNLPNTSAIAIADGARGSADWNTVSPYLRPGATQWTNLMGGLAYLKQQIQYNSGNMVNNPGSLPYLQAGMILKLGETAAGQNVSAQNYASTTNTSSEMNQLVNMWQLADISDTPLSGGSPVFAQAQTPAGGQGFGSANQVFQISQSIGQYALQQRLFVCCGPCFPYPYQSDQVHPNPLASQFNGAQLGKWAAWWHQGKKCYPFIMQSVQMVSSAVAEITFFNPTSTSLQFYSNSVFPSLAAINQGFSYLDKNASGITITNVALATNNSISSFGNNVIHITLSANPFTANNLNVATFNLGAINYYSDWCIFGEFEILAFRFML